MDSDNAVQNRKLLGRESTLLLVVDVQERLVPVIDRHEQMIENIRRLIEGAKILSLPLLVSEQYPKGLGPTVEPLRSLFDPSRVVEKLSFSCLGDKTPAERLAACKRDTLLVCGVEAHVCVSQTVLDCLSAGYRVHVAADAVSSRAPENRRIALERMARAGAVITSTEAALFELLERAGTEEFKAVSRLVK